MGHRFALGQFLQAAINTSPKKEPVHDLFDGSVFRRLFNDLERGFLAAIRHGGLA